MKYHDSPGEKMKGIIIALIGAWLSGLAIPGIKYFLADISPFNLIFISNVGAVVIIFFAKTIFSPGYRNPSKKEWIFLTAALIMGSLIAVPFAIIGMITVSGSVSGLLFNLEMFFTFYLAFFIFKEKMSWKAQLAMWLVFSGGIVSALGGPVAGELKGMILIMISCVFFSIQTNLLKKVESLDSFSLAGIEFMATLAVSFVAGRLLNHALPAFDQGLKLLTLGVLTYAFGNVLFYKSLKKIGAGRTSTIFGTAPLLGAVSSFLILGDPITPTITIGIVLVIVGLGVLSLEGRMSASQF